MGDVHCTGLNGNINGIGINGKPTVNNVIDDGDDDDEDEGDDDDSNVNCNSNNINNQIKNGDKKPCMNGISNRNCKKINKCNGKSDSNKNCLGIAHMNGDNSKTAHL